MKQDTQTDTHIHRKTQTDWETETHRQAKRQFPFKCKDAACFKQKLLILINLFLNSVVLNSGHTRLMLSPLMLGTLSTNLKVRFSPFFPPLQSVYVASSLSVCRPLSYFPIRLSLCFTVYLTVPVNIRWKILPSLCLFLLYCVCIINLLLGLWLCVKPCFCICFSLKDHTVENNKSEIYGKESPKLKASR